MTVRLPVFLVLVGVLVCRPGEAQSLDGPSSPPQDTAAAPTPSSSSSIQPSSRTALSVWIGGASSTGGIIGKIPEGEFGLIGLRYSRRLHPSASNAGPVSLTYTADLFPVVFLSIPSNAMPKPPVPPDESDPNDGSTSMNRRRDLDTYGVGGNPVGLRINFWPTTRVQPFIAGSGGFVYFLRSMPNERGKHLNFTFDVGGGLLLVVSPRATLTVGYRYQHLSNGFRGQINPGVDANLFYFGISVSQ